MSHSVLIAASLYPLARIPANGPNSWSRISFFFLPMARRSRSACPRLYPATAARSSRPVPGRRSRRRSVEDVLERFGQLRVDRGDRLALVLAVGVVVVGVGPMGPGRYSARTALMSSNESGFIERSSARIGPPSSWKTPRVSPRAKSR